MGDIPHNNMEEEEGSFLSARNGDVGDSSGTQGHMDSLTVDSLDGEASGQNSSDWEQVRERLGFNHILSMTISSDDDDEPCESFDISAEIQAGADERFKKFEEGQKLRALRSSNMTHRQKLPVVPGPGPTNDNSPIQRNLNNQTQLFGGERVSSSETRKTTEQCITRPMTPRPGNGNIRSIPIRTNLGDEMVPISPVVEKSRKGQQKLVLTHNEEQNNANKEASMDDAETCNSLDTSAQKKMRQFEKAETRSVARALRSQTKEYQQKVVGGNGVNLTELSMAMDTSSIPTNNTNATGTVNDDEGLSESTGTPAPIPQRRQSVRLLTASRYYKGSSNLSKSKFRPATPIPSGAILRTSHRPAKSGLLGSTPMRTGPFQQSTCFSPIIGMGSEVRNRLMVTQELEQSPIPNSQGLSDSTPFRGNEMASIGQRRLTRSSGRLHCKTSPHLDNTDSAKTMRASGCTKGSQNSTGESHQKKRTKPSIKIPLPGSNANANSPQCSSNAVAGPSGSHQASPPTPRRSTRLSRRDTFEKGLSSDTSLETHRRTKKGVKTQKRYVGKDPFGNYHMMKVSAVREIWEAERPGQVLDDETMKKFALKVNHYLEDFFVHHCENTAQPLGFIPFKTLHEALVSEGLISEDMDSDALLRQMKEDMTPEHWKAAEGVLIPTRFSKNGDNNDYLFK